MRRILDLLADLCDHAAGWLAKAAAWLDSIITTKE